MPRKTGIKSEGGRPSKSNTPRRGKQDDDDGSSEKQVEAPAPQEMFPAYQVPVPKPLTQTEKAQVAAYRELKERIHKGPLYAVLRDDVRVNKQRGFRPSAPIVTDPFDGVETYSQRYREQKRTLPKLDTRSYVLKFFPKELWSALDPSLSSKRDATKARKKRLQPSGATVEKQGVNDADPPAIKNESDDEDGEGRVVQDGDQAEDVMDDAFESDEDEMAGDYNAEGYFDDGGEDAGDDYDAGDGDDGGYF